MLNQKDPDVIVTTEPMLTKTDEGETDTVTACLLYTSPSPRD